MIDDLRASILGDPGTVSRAGRKARRDESFQARTETPPGTDSHRTISKRSSDWWLLIRHKKFFVLLCPIGEQFLLSSLALGDLQLGDLIINGHIVTINNWPMKFVEVYVLGNLRMTINKGYSGVFELNISVYQSREVCALNTSAF